MPNAGAELITICVPTHRRPALLLQALQSCIAQQYRPLEIDIGDDSPTGETEQLVHGIALPPGITLRYERHCPGLGQAGNVNRLFARARGARLILLHDDDLFLPGAITALAAAWHSSPDICLVYGMQEVVDENGTLRAADTEHHNRHANRTPAFSGVRYDLLVRALWRQVPNNCYLIDSGTARAVGYRSFEDIGDACDTDFSIRLACHARGAAFAFIDRMTSQYRLNWSGLNQSNNISWKFFDYVSNLTDLSAAENAARDELLTKIAAKATVENALVRRRRVALRIFCSRFYPRRHGWVKSAYHLALIAAPQVGALRRFAPRRG